MREADKTGGMEAAAALRHPQITEAKALGLGFENKSSCANGVVQLAWEDQRAASSLGEGPPPACRRAQVGGGGAACRRAPGKKQSEEETNETRSVFWIDGGRGSLGRSDQIKGRKVKNESEECGMALQQGVHVS